MRSINTWSNVAYKLTFGISALGVVGALSSVFDPQTLPLWLLLIIALLPLVVFLFIQPGEGLSERFVRRSRLFAVGWYAISGSGALLAALMALPIGEFAFYSAVISIGVLPCIAFARSLKRSG